LSTFVTLIEAAERGDGGAKEQLFSALYSELHRMAKRQLARHGGQNSLGASTLLHQTYLDISQRSGAGFPDQARFMGYAARVMRGLIIDHVRSRQAQKRGGRFEITALNSQVENAANAANATELTQISDALEDLAKLEPALCEVVDLKFFCGFSFSEIAAMRGISERTVQRNWEKARIYLRRSLRPDIAL
jgi:RNA polymerase sigma factor (TIGR02999 family)